MTILAERIRSVFKIVPQATDPQVAQATGYTLEQVRAQRRFYRQQTGDPSMHHTGKEDQIHRVLANRTGLTIYESNGELGTTGKPGVCTRAYEKHGVVTSMMTRDGDIMVTTYKAILSGAQYDVLDLDPYSEAMEPLDVGILKICKPQSLLFLTWAPYTQLRRRPLLRLRGLRIAGTDDLNSEARDRFVKGVALKYGFQAEKIDEVMFDRTARQVWSLKKITFKGSWCQMADVEYFKELVDAS